MAIAAVCLASLAAACSKDSNLVAGPTPPPPTPAPAANISGAWTGTFSQPFSTRCGTTGGASASFQQNGSSLSGIFSTPGPCGFGKVPFQGVLMGDTITGTAKGGILDDEFDSARGALNGPNQMHVGFFGSSGLIYALDLHR